MFKINKKQDLIKGNQVQLHAQYTRHSTTLPKIYKPNPLTAPLQQPLSSSLRRGEGLACSDNLALAGGTRWRHKVTALADGTGS